MEFLKDIKERLGDHDPSQVKIKAQINFFSDRRIGFRRTFQ